MSISKMFNSDITASWKTKPSCSVCSTQFNSSNSLRSRPLILPCYHNVCERCVFSNGQQTYLKCGVCDTKAFYTKCKPFRQIFEMNYYLSGFLYYKDYVLDGDLNRNIKESNNYGNIAVSRRHECNECIREYTEHFCIQCSVPYCISCFKRLHQTGKSFQKHILSLLERDDNVFLNTYKEVKNCPMHKQILNKYCQKCKEIICDICVTANHSDHLITSLQHENNKYLLQINSLIETVKMAINTNQQSLKSTSVNITYT